MSIRNSVRLFVMLAVAEAASAWSLPDFMIFPGGGASTDGSTSYETSIGGHTLLNGNISSNQDLFQQGNPLEGYPAQLNGSALAGGNLTFGQDLTAGSSTSPRQVIANSYTLGSGAVASGGATAPSGTTFEITSMSAAASFMADGANQTVFSGNGSSLTLAPGRLATSAQNPTVILSSGNYYFNAVTSQGGFNLQVDVTSGNPDDIYFVGDASFAQHNTLTVKGAGTGDAFVPISRAKSLAGLIHLETADHGNWTYVPLVNPVPEPQTVAMMLSGLALMGFIARRRKQSAMRD